MQIGPLENFGSKLGPSKFGPLKMLVRQIRPQKIFHQQIGPPEDFGVGNLGNIYSGPNLLGAYLPYQYLFRARFAEARFPGPNFPHQYLFSAQFAAPISIQGPICRGPISRAQFPAPIFILVPICCTYIYSGPNLLHQYLFGAQYAGARFA